LPANKLGDVATRKPFPASLVSENTFVRKEKEQH
jgi:hypothetical protein